MNADIIKETLRKQLELLSERSAGAHTDDLVRLTSAMVAVTSELRAVSAKAQIDLQIDGTSVAKAFVNCGDG